MVAIMVSGKGDGNFKGIDPGVHNARCDLIADLGMQETKFGQKHKLYVHFAVPGMEAEDKDGRKFQMGIGQSFTASLSPKSNLRKALEAWRGKPFSDEEVEGFDITKLLNAPATIVVGTFISNGEERSKLDNILKCRTSVGELIRKPVAYSTESTKAELAEAPQWIREKIEEQLALKGATTGGFSDADEELQRQYEQAHSQQDEDDIPF
jgi:hypothetical protein